MPDDAIIEEQTFEQAIRAADLLVRREDAGSIALVHHDAGWRERAPTDKQIDLLRRYGLPMPDGLTREQAGWIIVQHIAAGGSRRRQR